jgi:hypothetical protein
MNQADDDKSVLQRHWVSVAELEALLNQETCNIDTDVYELQTVTLFHLLGVDGFLAILNGKLAKHWRQCPVDEMNKMRRKREREQDAERKDQFVRHTDGLIYVSIPFDHIFDVVNDNGLEDETKDGQNSWCVNTRLEDFINRYYELDNDRSLAMLRVINRIMKYQTDVNPWGMSQIYFSWQDIERLYEGYRTVIDPSLPTVEALAADLLRDTSVQHFFQVVRGLPSPLAVDNPNAHMMPNNGGPQFLGVIHLKTTNLKKNHKFKLGH